MEITLNMPVQQLKTSDGAFRCINFSYTDIHNKIQWKQIDVGNEKNARKHNMDTHKEENFSGGN